MQQLRSEAESALRSATFFQRRKFAATIAELDAKLEQARGKRRLIRERNARAERLRELTAELRSLRERRAGLAEGSEPARALERRFEQIVAEAAALKAAGR